MSDAAKTLFGVHAAALGLRAERLNLISANLANADTPGYKAQDLDFASALRAATGQGGPVPLKVTARGHIGGAPAASASARVFRTPTQPSLDGNTVDAQMEHAAFARAALEYRASLSFFDSRVRSLFTAITGQ